VQEFALQFFAEQGWEIPDSDTQKYNELKEMREALHARERLAQETQRNNQLRKITQKSPERIAKDQLRGQVADLQKQLDEARATGAPDDVINGLKEKIDNANELVKKITNNPGSDDVKGLLENAKQILQSSIEQKTLSDMTLEAIKKVVESTAQAYAQAKNFPPASLDDMKSVIKDVAGNIPGWEQRCET